MSEFPDALLVIDNSRYPLIVAVNEGSSATIQLLLKAHLDSNIPIPAESLKSYLFSKNTIAKMSDFDTIFDLILESDSSMDATQVVVALSLQSKGWLQ